MLLDRTNAAWTIGFRWPILVFMLVYYLWSEMARPSLAAVTLTPADHNLKRYNGEQVIVACSATPKEAIPRWYSPSLSEITEDSNQRIHIERRNDNVILRLKGVRSEDRGVWSCTADTYGKRSFTLEVEDPLILQANSVEYAPLEETHFISCVASGTIKAEFTWRKGPHKHKLTSSKYRVSQSGLHIASVSLADNDTFWCTADMYEKGITVDHPIRIIVSKAVTVPHITCAGNPCAVQGGRAVLRCESSGLPQPKYQWSKGPALQIQSNPDFKYHTDGNSLVINKLNRSDDGVYKCRAFNEYDKLGKEVDYKIKVLVPPNIDPISAPSISRDETTDLICAVDPNSSPPVYFNWFHQDGKLIKENEHFQIIDDPRNFRSVLRVINANKNHFLNYTCEAKNVAGVRRSNGELRINLPCAQSENTTTVFYGLSELESRVQCTFDSYPMPSITWHVDRPQSPEIRVGQRGVRTITLSQTGPYQWTSFLKIAPSSLESDLMLYCSARNPRHHESSTVQITLRKATLPDPPTFGQRVTSFINTASFSVQLPTNTGGLPIKHVEVRYKPVQNKLQLLEPAYLSERFNVSEGQKSILITLTNLFPSTFYRIGLVSITDFGESKTKENLFQTRGQTHPLFDVGVASAGLLNGSAFTLVNSSENVIPCGFFSSCIIKWRMLSDGGSPVSKITIDHLRVRSSAVFDSRQRKNAITIFKPLPVEPAGYELKNLLPLSRYMIEFNASNQFGTGTKLFYVKTSASPPGYRELQEARKRPGVWAVIGIILLIVILLVFLCMFVVCLRMPKPTSSSAQNFMGKIAGVSSATNQAFFDVNDFRDSMQPLNGGDTSRNFNPLYKENTGFESPWNTFLSESRSVVDKQRSLPPSITKNGFNLKNDSSRV